MCNTVGFAATLCHACHGAPGHPSLSILSTLPFPWRAGWLLPARAHVPFSSSIPRAVGERQAGPGALWPRKQYAGRGGGLWDQLQLGQALHSTLVEVASRPAQGGL